MVEPVIILFLAPFCPSFCSSTLSPVVLVHFLHNILSATQVRSSWVNVKESVADTSSEVTASARAPELLVILHQLACTFCEQSRKIMVEFAFCVMCSCCWLTVELGGGSCGPAELPRVCAAAGPNARDRSICRKRKAHPHRS